MAKQMIRPYSFLLYFLAFVVSFFVGISYAGWIEAGKNQMLAGGAIVLGYGVVGASIGLILSLMITYRASRKTIIRLNVVLPLIIIAFWAYYAIKYQKRQKAKMEQEQPKKIAPTVPVPDSSMPLISLASNESSGKTKTMPQDMVTLQSNPTLGLGMFAPAIHELNTLYFYANTNPDKPLDEHMPYDSITFKLDQNDQVIIATAPPWLHPQHLKLDYGIMYFKIKTIWRDLVEVEVNTATGQTSLVSPDAGKIVFWPDFLLNVHSLEFADHVLQSVKVKPLDHAGEVFTPHSIMQPLAVRQDWMMVKLLDNHYNKVGFGWIKWQKNSELLVRYSFLS